MAAFLLAFSDVAPVVVGQWYVNTIVLLTVLWFIGVLIHLLQRASSAFRSKVNVYPSRWCFLRDNWDIFLVRTFISAVLYSLWIKNPGMISGWLSYCGVAAGIANFVTIPPTLTTAAIFGYLSDTGLDQFQLLVQTSPKFAWVPSLFKGEIPKYDPAVVIVEKLSADRKVGE